VYLCAEEANETSSYFGVTVRNSAIEDRFARSRNETEPVAKILLNADVRGEQTTVTETRLRVLPSEEEIRFDVVNVGQIVSQTTGISRQAMVESQGLQNFEAIKPFWFDGRKFLTKPAHGTILASQAPQRVVSSVGTRMPLLRGMGDRIAWSEVVRRGPQINQAVAADVSKDVFPKVDRIVNQEFAALGHEWSELQRSISEVSGETQISWSARSSESLATVWAISENVVTTVLWYLDH
jgi:hypothetical protein